MDITDYLSREKMVEIATEIFQDKCKDYFSSEENTMRILSNLSYKVVGEEIDKVVPNHKRVIIGKVAEIIKNKDLSGQIFRNHWASNKPESLASIIVEETVRENRQLIKERVIQSIKEKDFSEDTLMKFEQLTEDFTSNIYDMVQTLKGN